MLLIRFLRKRKKEAIYFMMNYRKDIESEDARNVQRQAFAGLLWSKQFYYFNVHQWLKGDPAQPEPPPERKKGRNHEWKHLNNSSIISMPDKWEYPWYAAWDLCFHAVAFMPMTRILPRTNYYLLTKNGICIPTGNCLHMNGHFGDVNPPVHAWAAWRVYRGNKDFTR